MTASVSLLPQMVGAFLPTPNVQGLSDDEQGLVAGLASKLAVQSVSVLESWLYYDGLQRMSNLGISVPQILAGVRTVVDWPRVAVDPLVQRWVIDGYRLPGSTDTDSELAEHCRANDFDSELPLAFLDSLVGGRGYIIVGAPDTPGDSPLVTVESPLNLAVQWDPRTRRITAAFQSYEAEGRYKAALYLPEQSIYMSRDEQSPEWTIDKRDEHHFGEVTVVRLPNRSRTSDREGRSQITPAVRNTTDSACRTLLGMEIAREFYSIPHKYAVGLAEKDFVGPDGQPRTSLDMAMSKFLAFEGNENGELPTVGQFKAMDPSVFTKMIDKGAQLMSSYTGFPAEMFGQVTAANPASADAIRSAQDAMNRAATEKQGMSTRPVVKVGQLMWRYANGGRELTDEIRRLGVDWVDAATPTPAATTDALSKQIASGMVPATSDVTLAKAGYTAAQRARLEQDRNLDQAAQLEAELTSSLAARQARAGNAIANDLATASEPPTAPTTGTQP